MGKTITYNLLNLPQTVSQQNNSSATLASYYYDAAGQQLRNTGSDGYWDYDNGIVYNGTTATNGTIQYIQTEEGRAVPVGGSWNYEYNLKDQLGNVRLSFDKDPTLGTARRVQEDEYYAFGLRSPVYDLSNHNRYLYNGKEVQTDLANQYDYGARFYDPVIGRWTSEDPLAEINRRFSPYNYVENNPIRLIDPDGMWASDATGNQSTTDPGEIAAFFARMKKKADEADKKRDNLPSVKAWKKRTAAADKAYGSTVAARALNWRYWYDDLFGEGGFESAPYINKGTIGDNPIGWLASGPVGIAKEIKIISEAEDILKESSLLTDAFKAGKGVELKIGGRTIIVEPEAPMSGMTLFGEKAFVLGKEAFASGEELAKTILHELYRLSNSAGGATNESKAAQETKAASNFAERAFKMLKK